MAINYAQILQSAFQGMAANAGSGNFDQYKTPSMKGLDSVLAGVYSGLSSTYNNLITRYLQPGVWKQMMREHLTGAEREQNAFNAQQAALARAFNADEAWKQRYFTQGLFNKSVELENSAFQRQVLDMKKAGVNPALMYGGVGASGAGVPSAGSGTAASGPAASGSPSAPADLHAMSQLAMSGAQMRLLDAQTSLVNAQTHKVSSETRGIDIDNQHKPEYWKNYVDLLGNNSRQAAASADKLLQEKDTEVFRTAAAKAGVTTVELENDLLVWKNLMSEMDAEMYRDFQNVQLRLSESTADLTDEQIELARNQSAELMVRAVLEAAEAHQLDAETWRILKENKIIKDNSDTFEAFIKGGWKVTIAEGATRKLSAIIGAVSDAIGSATGVVGVSMLGKSFMKTGSRIGYK